MSVFDKRYVADFARGIGNNAGKVSKQAGHCAVGFAKGIGFVAVAGAIIYSISLCGINYRDVRSEKIVYQGTIKDISVSIIHVDRKLADDNYIVFMEDGKGNTLYSSSYYLADIFNPNPKSEFHFDNGDILNIVGNDATLTYPDGKTVFIDPKKWGQ